MSNFKVKWSPIYPDLFCTYGPSKILLYKVVKELDRSQQKVPVVKQLSDKTWAIEQPNNIEVGMLKTVAWYPKPEPDKMLALGLANGRVILNSFSESDDELIKKEFVPKHTRSCIYLHWNPTDCHLLAEGLEKYRNDSCINIWNIHQKASNELGTDRQRYSSSHSDSGSIHQPYVEIGGASDTTASFSWFQKESRTFVTGMNTRYLRIYDMRDCTRPQSITQTKMIRGVCVNPLNEHRLASFNENHVCIWDVRNFDKPILTFQEPKAVSMIAWSPTRKGYLSVLSQESLSVKVYDIIHLPPTDGSEEIEPYFSERVVKAINNNIVTSFSWHPTHENRLITITQQAILRDIHVNEHIPFVWSADFHLVLASGKSMYDSELQGDITKQDISVRIRKRAVQGYGLQADHIWHNVYAVKDELHLIGVWRWLSLSREMTDDLKSRPTSNKSIMGRHTGVKSILNLESELPSPTQSNWMYWSSDANFTRRMSTVRQYHSHERCMALQLCGWGGQPEHTETILHELQMDGKYSVAAAMALFTLQISKAIEILSTSNIRTEDNTDLNTVAMAIAGFSEDKNTLWRKTCSNLLQKLTDPYLRAMFTFLSSEGENYDDMLNDQEGMQLSDKIAFACIYLDDDKLRDYITKLTRRMIDMGHLDGLLITGLSSEGVSLIQRFVDITGDVQTAALVCVFASPCEMSKDERVRNWIESYRELLDRWRLWHHRAKFDIIWHASDNFRVVSQAFVSCNFCGKSIACNMPVASRRRPNMSYSAGTLSSTKPKVTCCPGCRKPLPRCSLCLTHLGTPSGSALYTQKEKTTYNVKMTPTDDWFTWCQSCRHGGHSSHLAQWFLEHLECPVTGCECKCSSLDHTGKLTAEAINCSDE